MVSSKADHPNCMYMWMDYISQPEVKAQVAYYFGEAPANPQGLRPDRGQDHCDAYQATDEAFDKVAFWATPTRSASTAAATSACPTPSGSRPGPRSRADRRRGRRSARQPHRACRAREPQPLAGLGGVPRLRLGLLLAPRSAGWGSSTSARSSSCSSRRSGRSNDFTGLIVKGFSLDNFQPICRRAGVPQDRAADGVLAALVTVIDIVLAFPIAFYMAKVVAAARACSSSRC